MRFQQLVNKNFRNRFVASLLTSCDNAVPTSLLTSCDNVVPTTCQQCMSPQQACINVYCVSFKIVFSFVLILDILIIRSNSLKRFRNILQWSKKLPYQRNDEINKNFQTQFFRTTILLYKNYIFINIS